jgi:hypothetical protein
LNQAIQMVQSDMSKHKEALEDCLKYKEFLDGLTPAEFFESQAEKKRNRQEERRQERIKKKVSVLPETKLGTLPSIKHSHAPSA